MFSWALKKVLGTNHEREINKLQPLVEKINSLEPEYQKLDDQALKSKTVSFKEQLSQGASLDHILPDAFATVREAGKRVLGMRHYDVQLIGGMVLHGGRIAEMRTGEGKTLVATLPCYLNALEGKGVHVVTVNDYLATRDAEWMGQLHNFLGLNVGVVVPQQDNVSKKRAYQADITYGQNNEFGFDYLRDNMKFSIYEYAQRELNFAIVDEVDSILIDEARTPLIISGPGEKASSKYQAIDEIIPKLRKDEHYQVEEKSRSITLTDSGIETAQSIMHQQGLIENENLYDPVNLESLHILEQCLKAHNLFKRDQNYMVSPDGKVMIIDEFTGRVLPGRRWSDGLHQAVEAKERVAIQDENQTLATISFQNLFRLYNKLSGMTGTADTEAGEFHKIYNLDVVVIPTNKPIQRKDHEDLVYKSEKEKFRALVKEIGTCHEKGQPVLVGTTSVEKSDAISRILDKSQIPHHVLNAKQHEREAYVVAQAGQIGAITVATNMAGRGTDIVLGGNPEMLAKLEVINQKTALSEEALASFDEQTALEDAIRKLESACKEQGEKVKELGGLHIIGTERHESRRIDNQLRGRAGRQGDPGSSRFYLSLEDDLMRIFGGERMQMMMSRLGMEDDEPIEHKWVTRAVENSQKKVEERNFDIRKNMLEYDDVLNQQRKNIYALRRQVLTGQYREQIQDSNAVQDSIYNPDSEIVERITPLLEQMIRFHGSPLPGPDASDAEVKAHRQNLPNIPLSNVEELRVQAFEKDVYRWFGCLVSLEKYKNEPEKTLDYLKEEIGISLTEQNERLLDLMDELISTMVEIHCPPKGHIEDWNKDALREQFKNQFNLEPTGIDEITESQEMVDKLFKDAESTLRDKEKLFGSENFLRLFRNIYLEEIDRQWLVHLQSMDALREGIGLRGYGQRDPKREYKREGFSMYLRLIDQIKASVGSKIFRAEKIAEEDLKQIEERRRKSAEKMQQKISSSQAGKNLSNAISRGGQRSDLAEQPQTIRREKPKVGRNSPCWCGSGKKYKNCHYREDQNLQEDANA